MTRPYLKIKVDEKQTFGWKTLWYPGHVDRSTHKTPAAFIFARRMLKAVGKASVSRAGAKPASFTSKKVPAGKVAIYNSNFATFSARGCAKGCQLRLVSS